MTGEEQSFLKPPPPDTTTAEEVRKIIKELVETPPAKTMADVKAASEVFEAAAEEKAQREKPAKG